MRRAAPLPPLVCGGLRVSLPRPNPTRTYPDQLQSVWAEITPEIFERKFTIQEQALQLVNKEAQETWEEINKQFWPEFWEKANELCGGIQFFVGNDFGVQTVNTKFRFAITTLHGGESHQVEYIHQCDLALQFETFYKDDDAMESLWIVTMTLKTGGNPNNDTLNITNEASAGWYQNQQNKTKALIVIPKETRSEAQKKGNDILYDIKFELRVEEVPEWIGELTALERLDLSHNGLKSLPTQIGNLKALKSLDLRRNELESLPESIVELTVLERLDLSYNQLKSLPTQIGNLTALKSLNLSGNNLKSLPESIGNLTGLERLDLDGNVDLDGNGLKSLPTQIGNLKALRAACEGGAHPAC